VAHRSADPRSADKELNLLPFMNLVTLLIPLLLIASQFVELAVIDSTVPGIIASDGPPPGLEEPLVLRLEVTTAAVTVRGAEGVLGETPVFPCTGGCRTGEAVDLAALGAALQQVKAARPDAEEVWVEPDNAVPFDVLVAVMDASRASAQGPLFPAVRFAG
jgi:biopolymer transport protein ExbD